jgi:hypothetical protein
MSRIPPAQDMRVPPPRQAREITIWQPDMRVSKPLFQTTMQVASDATGSRDRLRWSVA